MSKFLALLCLSFLLVSCNSSASNSKEDQEKIENTSTLKDGPYREFYDDGSIKVIGKIKNGKRVGKWSSWFKSGELQSELAYKNGLEHGIYQVYYKNGSTKILGNYKDGKEIGEWQFFTEDGNLAQSKNYEKE